MAELTEITLAAATRTGRGGRYNLKLRMEGRIPAIVYGQKSEPQAISLDLLEFTDALHTGRQMVYLKVDGKAEAKPDLMLIKAVQLDHLGSTVLHVDFNRVDIHKKVRVPLHLELRGKPAGAEEGGVLNQVLQQIEVECLPLDIPREALKVSVVDMKVGDILHVKELKLPATIHAVTGGDTVVATVKVPAAKAEAAAPAEGEAEPEVLKKGKGEEGEAAAGAAAAAPAAKAEKK